MVVLITLDERLLGSTVVQPHSLHAVLLRLLQVLQFHHTYQNVRRVEWIGFGSDWLLNP